MEITIKLPTFKWINNLFREKNIYDCKDLLDLQTFVYKKCPTIHIRRSEEKFTYLIVDLKLKYQYETCLDFQALKEFIDINFINNKITY
jgi:hypothetical protein